MKLLPPHLHDPITCALQQRLVMTHKHEGAGGSCEEAGEPLDGGAVEVVGGLVEEEAAAGGALGGGLAGVAEQQAGEGAVCGRVMSGWGDECFGGDRCRRGEGGSLMERGEEVGVWSVSVAVTETLAPSPS